MSTRPQPVDRIEPEPEPESASPLPGQSRGRRALEFFDELLFENPEVCSNCYARIRDHTEHDDSANRLGTGNRPTETLERAGSGTVGHDVEVKDAYGEITRHHARTYCGECGSPGGANSGDDYSLQQARGVADTIARRLHEAGYYLDVAAFYEAVASLKNRPDMQGRDRQIFAAAAFLGVERGRRRTGVPGLVRADAMPPIRRRPPSEPET